MSFEEDSGIEKIQLEISETQKKIKLNYSILHTEELSDLEIEQVNLEINQLNRSVMVLQSKLREIYREHFSQGAPKKSDAV